MVMSVSPVHNAVQAGKYFTQDNYYREEDSQETAWGGALAEEFEIEGQAIDQTLFFSMLTGQMPSGERVQKSGAGSTHKPATDLTFNAPKDVSLAAYNAGDARVIDAHRRAVAATMAYAERELAVWRRTEDGVTRPERTGSMLWARFTHDTNRDEGSHLHDHILVLNATRTQDGPLRALENRLLYQNQMLLGAMYHASLRNELELIGYHTFDLANAKNGEFGLAEIDQNFAKEEATRRGAAEDWLSKKGIDPASATPKDFDRAVKATRSAKREIDHDALHDRQQAEFRERFPDWKTPAGTADKPLDREMNLTERASAAVDFALEHHLEKSNIVRQRDVLRSAIVAGESVPPVVVEAEIRNRIADGRMVLGDRDMVTTAAAQERERDMLAVVDRGRGAMAPAASAIRADALLGSSVTTEVSPVLSMNLVPTWHVPRGLDGRPLLDASQMAKSQVKRTDRQAEAGMLTGKLNDGQLRAAELMLTSTDRVNIIQGVAGAGKTHMLSTVREELEAQGFTIVALAPSHQAAGELRNAIGSGNTLQSFLADPRARAGFNDKSIIICDEAGMASSLQMRDLLAHAEAANARVVLIGDDRQYKAVEAGNPFRQLQQHGTAMAEMDESVRQKDPRLKEAVALMNAGQMRNGLALFPTTEIVDKEARHAAITADYLAQGDDRKNSLVLTGTNADRRALNARIREGLGLAGNGKEIDVVDKADLSGAEQRKAKNYEVGQMVQFQKDFKRLGVHAKDMLAIEAVNTQSGTVKLRGQDGRAVDFQPHQHENTKAWTVLNKEKMEFAVGDEVRFRSTQKTGERDANGAAVVDWHNNDRGRVVALDAERGTMQVANDSKDGKLVELDLSKPQALTHAYAATGHSAQGMTVDKALTDYNTESPTTSKESVYTNSTRARFETAVYTNDQAALLDKAEKGVDKSNALDLAQAKDLHREPDRTAQIEADNIRAGVGQAPAGGQSAEREVEKSGQEQVPPERECETEKPLDHELQGEHAAAKDSTAEVDIELAAELHDVCSEGEADLAKSGFYAEREAPESGPDLQADAGVEMEID